MRKHGDELAFSATEVGNFLACQHLTALELRVLEGELTRPAQNDIERRLLEKRGLDHEARVLEWFRAQGKQVLELKVAVGEVALRQAAEQTLAAMQAGAEVIYQGTLLTPGWLGRPDFLRRVGDGGRLGHRYEPIDAKLSRYEKARAVLQLCAYADQLAELQGVLPEKFYIVGGGDSIAPRELLTADYAAYFRSVRLRLQQFVSDASGAPESYPEPVEHCDVCRFWKRCQDRRRADDHLSLVAGISRRQRDRLTLAGVERLEALGLLDQTERVAGISPEALERVRQQASLQLRGRREGHALYELLPSETPGVGLEALPKPTPGDLFLDLEGDAFVAEGGLDYLFGLVDFGEPELDFTVRDAPGEPRYRAFWAENSQQERSAFEQVIDRVLLGREEFPDLHLFHFGHREADALKKLSCRHATREAEVDQLLREGVLVDLLPIVRHGLRASVESYSLKELESLHGFERTTPLRDAAQAMQLFGYWLETTEAGMSSRVPELKGTVQAYNREDCLSTWRLRDFLEGLRRELELREGRVLPRPSRKETKATAPNERRQAAGALARKLTADAEHPQAAARQLLAHLLEFHWREAKSGWWEHYRARDLPPADRLEDRSCIAELSSDGEVDRVKQSIVYQYSFPEQEHSLRLTPQPCDADTGGSAGQVIEIGARHVRIKRGLRKAAEHPRALIVGRPIDAALLEDSLFALGEAVLSGEPGYAAAQALLLRTPPARFHGLPLCAANETPQAALLRLAEDLAGSVIAVQGPPGSGKTYQAAQLILGLLRRGQRVGVTANSHAVIKHLLDRVLQRAAEANEPDLVRAVHVAEESDEEAPRFRVDSDKERVRRELSSGRINLVGGTAWTWSRPDFAGSVDALVIDEAGQMSLANALAVARAGHGLVLFGDPAQLEQPQKGVHPLGAEVSTLEHWLGGEALTIPAHLGVFLPKTRRLHPAICAFISDVFYEGRLSTESDLGLERQALLLPGEGEASGMRFHAVSHRGNTSHAPEEVDAVVAIVLRLLAEGRFRDRAGAERRLTPDDVLVVAPYNAQVAALRRALPQAVRVGTVDKFQGREAPVVVYSMTCSSAEDAPRGLEFLFSRNRLNVAVSRAQALCVLVASPELARASCRTPRQIRLVNALCAFLERARA